MAAGKKPLSETAPIADYAADIHTDPRMRAAWLEVAAARMAANLLRAARQRHELNQADLAQRLGVSQARISQIESGRVEDIPSLELVSRFLDACGERLVLTAEPMTARPAVDVAPRLVKAVDAEVEDEPMRQAPAGMD